MLLCYTVFWAPLTLTVNVLYIITSMRNTLLTQLHHPWSTATPATTPLHLLPVSAVSGSEGGGRPVRTIPDKKDTPMIDSGSANQRHRNTPESQHVPLFLLCASPPCYFCPPLLCATIFHKWQLCCSALSQPRLQAVPLGKGVSQCPDNVKHHQSKGADAQLKSQPHQILQLKVGVLCMHSLCCNYCNML